MNDQSPARTAKRERVLDILIWIEVILAIAALIFLAVCLAKPVREAIIAIHTFLTTSDM